MEQEIAEEKALREKRKERIKAFLGQGCGVLFQLTFQVVLCLLVILIIYIIRFLFDS